MSVDSDIDECADSNTNCSVDAACTNTDGGYTCTCHEGMEGNGFECYGELHCEHTFTNDMDTSRYE